MLRLAAVVGHLDDVVVVGQAADEAVVDYLEELETARVSFLSRVPFIALLRVLASRGPRADGNLIMKTAMPAGVFLRVSFERAEAEVAESGPGGATIAVDGVGSI